MSEDLPERLDVIAVGAHPDDVEMGCGGTLAKLVRQGYRVGIIDLTDGEPTPGSQGPEFRMAEAQQAAKILGVHERVTLDLPNRRLFDSYENRVKLAIQFRRHRPRLVLGIGEKTSMHSPDHWQAIQITDAAVFYSRLTKWDLEFDGTPPHIIEAQLYYTLVAHTTRLMDGAGQLIVDVTDTLDTKVRAVRCYTSQFPEHKQHIFPRIETWARQLGQAAGLEAGELLVSPRTLGTHDLMHTLFGERSQ